MRIDRTYTRPIQPNPKNNGLFCCDTGVLALLHAVPPGPDGFSVPAMRMAAACRPGAVRGPSCRHPGRPRPFTDFVAFDSGDAGRLRRPLPKPGTPQAGSGVFFFPAPWQRTGDGSRAAQWLVPSRCLAPPINEPPPPSMC